MKGPFGKCCFRRPEYTVVNSLYYGIVLIPSFGLVKSEYRADPDEMGMSSHASPSDPN